MTINPQRQQARALLRHSGRVTLAREQVLALLLAADRPLSHAELEQASAAAGTELDRVTLYRVLDYLVAQQLAHKVAGDDRVWRFNTQVGEAEGEGHAHAHFHCRSCGQLFCLDAGSSQLQLNLPAGYQLDRAEVTLRGRCPRCAGND